jgi:predicted dehydrogenase
MRTKRVQSVNVGLVGAGFLAETRARCYEACSGTAVDIVGVAARHRERAQDFARRWTIPHIYDGYRRLLDRPDVDVIDVCTPNYLHRDVVIAAAQAGKHVICTKPLTGYFGESGDQQPVGSTAKRAMFEVVTRDAEAMLRAAEVANIKLMYAENWVYAPAIQKARALVEASGGAILEMRGAECHSGSHSIYSRRWRDTGGGALIRLAAHPIGAALYLKRVEGVVRTGQPILPAAVIAETGSLSIAGSGAKQTGEWLVQDWVDVEDWGTILLTFTDGTKAILSGSDVHLGGLSSTLELTLTNARIVCHLSPTDLCTAYTPDVSVLSGTYLLEKLETTAGWSHPAPSEIWTHGHVQQIQDFMDAVTEDRPPQSDGHLGRDVVDVIYAAYVAAEEGRRVPLRHATPASA